MTATAGGAIGAATETGALDSADDGGVSRDDTLGCVVLPEETDVVSAGGAVMLSAALESLFDKVAAAAAITDTDGNSAAAVGAGAGTRD